MVEGKGSKNFAHVKQLIYNNPGLAHRILEQISDAVAEYLSAKIEAGVDAVQIFDTWGGILSQHDFKEFSLSYIEKVISKINKQKQPVIVFAKGVHFNLQDLASCGADVLGLDWTMDIGAVRRAVGSRVLYRVTLILQYYLLEKEVIRSEAKRVLESYGEGSGHIFNLGHGILPNIDPEKAKALVQFVKEESVKFHHKNAEIK